MVIESMSRLERSIKGLVERMKLFQGKGVHAVTWKESLGIIMGMLPFALVSLTLSLNAA